MHAKSSECFPQLKVLLHICCGVCGLYSIRRLKAEGFSVAGFFYNPNIHPEDEYRRRRQAAVILARQEKIELFKGPYRPRDWEDRCASYDSDREGGRRCRLCFKLRLEETYREASRRGCEYFCTTLTMSPHKVSAHVFEIGREIGRERFLAIDFKKQDGFKKTMALAKQYNLYRQTYCGCVYSNSKPAVP